MNDAKNLFDMTGYEQADTMALSEKLTPVIIKTAFPTTPKQLSVVLMLLTVRAALDGNYTLEHLEQTLAQAYETITNGQPTVVVLN